MASLVATRDVEAAARRRVAGRWILATLAVVAGTGLFLIPPIAQPAAYHAFHDGRTLLGIPNFLNVVSNAPFVWIGGAALMWLAQSEHRPGVEILRAYQVMFAGIGLTGIGSATYHWAPDNASLVWDRLPIALAAMGFYAAVLGERIGPSAARALLWPLVIYGVGSVVYWQQTGDLRFYLFAQFFPVLTIPLMLWMCPAQFTRGGHIWAALGLYVVAKVLEEYDGVVFGLGHLISGHTLKHVAAACAAWMIYRMLRIRQPIAA